MRPTDDVRGTATYPVVRRTVLLAGVASATLAGCSLNNPFDQGKTPAAEAVRDLAPDVAVAVEAVALLVAAAAAVDATRAAHPTLTGTLSGLATTHAAHVSALRAAVPERVDVSTQPAPYAVPPGRGTALAAIRATEATLQDKLVGLALRAESGAFARLLGTMSAALSQQLAVLGR